MKSFASLKIASTIGALGAVLLTAGGAEASRLSDGWSSTSQRSCYVRADGFGTYYQEPDATYSGPLPGGGVAPLGAVTEIDMDNGFGFDIGFGCASHRTVGGSFKDAPATVKRGPRFDVTYTFRNDADFTGVPPAAPPADPILTSIRSHALMVNAYWDFDLSRSITPYVGAGIGAANLRLDDTAVVNGATVTFDGDDQWNFAWQLMAGVSIALGHNMDLDIGYRFVNLGDVSTAATAFQGGVATGTSTLDIDDLYGHEFKIGVRVGLDGLMSGH